VKVSYDLADFRRQNERRHLAKAALSSLGCFASAPGWAGGQRHARTMRTKDVRLRVQSGIHLLAVSFSGFDPIAVLPKGLPHADSGNRPNMEVRTSNGR
jgi:hypothetical protein